MNIKLQNIKKKYNSFTALDSINLDIREGSLHFLLGPSGCGKTTLLRILAGLEKACYGKIFFNDKDITHLPTEKRKIGMVFQNYALWPHMSVLKNIQYGLKIQGFSKNEIKKRSQEVLDMCHLNEITNRFPSQISGGQQQRVALARALAIKPSILLLDEPLSNLDTKLRIEMRDNIRSIHEETGITIVYVTHDQKEALSIGTHISIINRGKIVETNSPKEIYQKPTTNFSAEFVGETNLVKATYSKFFEGEETVDTKLGNLQIKKTSLHFSKDEELYINIRPESFRLVKKTTKQKNNFLVKLKDLSYQGDCEVLTLETIENNKTLKARIFQNKTPLQKNKTYWFHVSSENIIAIPNYTKEKR